MPVSSEGFHDGIVLRGHGQKEHHYGVSLSGKECYDQNESAVCKMQCRRRLRHVGRWGNAMRMLRLVAVGAVLMAMASGNVSGGQPQMKQGQHFPGQVHQPADIDPLTDPHRLEQQEEARSTERQKRLVADTDKLLALATDLKQQVDKTNKNILSVDVIKKAEEIEKLAHSVKERMKG